MHEREGVGGSIYLALTGDIVPPARITHLDASTISRKWLAGFSCWYLISTRSFNTAVRMIRPSESVSMCYPVAKERATPSLGLASARRNTSTVCRGGVTPFLVSGKKIKLGKEVKMVRLTVV